MTHKTGLNPAFMELIKIMTGIAGILATWLADVNCKDSKCILQYTVFTGLTQSWDPFVWVGWIGWERGGINSVSDIKYQIRV